MQNENVDVNVVQVVAENVVQPIKKKKIKRSLENEADKKI